jgi:hypothetical protein
MHLTDGNMTEQATTMPSGRNIGMQTDPNTVLIQEVRHIIGKLQWDQTLLRQAIGSTLRAFGDPVMKTVLWHMETRGIFLDSNEKIDMRLFYEHLESLIGEASVVVMGEIVQSLIRADGERVREATSSMV